MKRFIAILLCLVLMLTGCAPSSEEFASSGDEAVTELEIETTSVEEAFEQAEYDDISDPEFLEYYEDVLYQDIVTSLDSENYFVEDVQAVFISKEYVDELQYNSMSNVYFGYTLDEIQEQFTGSKFVFALGDDGQTTVKEFEKYEEDNFEQVIKNVAIGAGVILVCVTVSVVAGAAGATAVSMIFAVSAKTGTAVALSDGLVSGVTAGIVKGIETGNFDEAMDAALLSASEGFKWGAITGCATGGAVETFALKGATLNGLTMNEAAKIQKETKFPLDVIKQFKNMDQYEICKKAGLYTENINGRTALIRDIDLNYVDVETGKTNLELMMNGYAPIDPSTGLKYQLHHVGQKSDSTLAILTQAEHMQGGNNTIWHDTSITTDVHGAGNSWDKQRKQFWKAMASYYESMR